MYSILTSSKMIYFPFMIHALCLLFDFCYKKQFAVDFIGKIKKKELKTSIQIGFELIDMISKSIKTINFNQLS